MRDECIRVSAEAGIIGGALESFKVLENNQAVVKL